MAKETYCPLCKEVVGECDHNRADMILTILDKWDKVEKLHVENKELLSS